MTPMRRWTMRLVWAVVLGGTFTAGLNARPHDPPVLADCPYRAATPYNAIVVGRPVPNPSWTMPNFTLCCDLPCQNLDPYVYPDCGWGNGCGGGWNGGCGSILGDAGGWGGCRGGCNGGCNAMLGHA